MQNQDFPVQDWEDAEDARLASRHGVANLIHSPRAREQFMRDDVSVSSALSRQTTAYGGQTKTEPVPHPDAAQPHRFRYQHHSHPIPLHVRRTRSVPSRRSPPPPLEDVGMYSDSVNRNDFVPSFGPSFDPPPSPPQDRRTMCPSSERRVCSCGRGARSHRARRRHSGRRQPRLNRAKLTHATGEAHSIGAATSRPASCLLLPASWLAPALF